MKNKGIKVKHRRRRKFKPKRKGNRIFSSVLWVTAICVALFFGYSVLAPFIDWLRTREKYTPEENLPPVSTTVTETTENTTTNRNIPAALPFSKGFFLSVEDLKSGDALTAALSAVPDGISDIVIPLKSKGGNVNFLTVNETAVTANAVSAALSLPDIYQHIKDSGFNPIAEIDLLNDNIYPLFFGDTSYFLSSGSRWYDNNPASGGKPWLSPYSAGTKTYLTALASEIAGAGVKDIILSGAEFPPFRESDMNIITSPVKSSDRYTVIYDIISDIKTLVGEDVKIAVTADATKIFSGTEDIFNSNINAGLNYRILFNLQGLNSDLNGSDLSSMSLTDRFRVAAEYLKSNYSDVTFTPILSKEGLTDDEITVCSDIAKQLELGNIYIR